MEIAIRLTLVMMVALLVSIGIIQFSQNTILKARNKIIDIDKDDIEGDRIVKLESLDANGAAYIAESCLKLYQYKEPLEAICYSVHVSTGTVPDKATIATAYGNLGYSNSDIIGTCGGGSKAIMFTFKHPKEIQVDC